MKLQITSLIALLLLSISANATTFTESTDTSNERLSATLLPAGTTYIKGTVHPIERVNADPYYKTGNYADADLYKFYLNSAVTLMIGMKATDFDAGLMLFNSKGNVLVTNDDHMSSNRCDIQKKIDHGYVVGRFDSCIKITLPAGAYYLSTTKHTSRASLTAGGMFVKDPQGSYIPDTMKNRVLGNVSTYNDSRESDNASYMVKFSVATGAKPEPKPQTPTKVCVSCGEGITFY